MIVFIVLGVVVVVGLLAWIEAVVMGWFETTPTQHNKFLIEQERQRIAVLMRMEQYEQQHALNALNQAAQRAQWDIDRIMGR